MKTRNHLLLKVLLSMLFFMPSISFARDYRDSILMNRIWSYNQKIHQKNMNTDENAYLVYTLDLKRRNFLLWLVPNMYSVARGDRRFIGEEYGKLVHSSKYDFHFDRQLVFSTIPRQRKPMPAMFEMQSPNYHGEQIFRDHLLSPFWKSNRRYYKYKILYLKDNMAMMVFTPRVNNTQLVKGMAMVNFLTGAVISTSFVAEFDMLKFRVVTKMNSNSGLPVTNNITASFNFLGNKILGTFSSYYGLSYTLPDSLKNRNNYNTIASVRPKPLTAYQDSIYLHHYEERKAREEKMIEKSKNKKNEEHPDSLSAFQEKFNKVKDFLWDDVGDYMVNSNDYQSKRSYMRISPLFNPLYMSYSTSKGISYKLSAAFSYNWNDNRYITLEPRFGYAFKVKQFYYTVPLTFTYNPKRGGRVSFVWENGNRTSSASLAETFTKRLGRDKSIRFPEFRDEHFKLFNHIGIFDWISLTTGVDYHIRKAMSTRQLLTALGLSVSYRSFAPYMAIHLSPWKSRGPVLTANYERSIMNILQSNLQYERWEFDASYKHNVKRMQILNLRAGSGFYTHRSTDYFVDFTNFCDNNLPTGWDDDWTGQFHLIDSRWYNESNYYIRGHISYDSPLLVVSWLPLVGRYLETERLYLSMLNIEHTRFYSEVGYGLKCRYFSAAVFASFLNNNYNSVGIKFDIELFRRW